MGCKHCPKLNKKGEYENPREYYDFVRDGWYKNVEFRGMAKQHKMNLKTLEAVQKWRENLDRPISVLLVHGSGRAPAGCAKEMSNSRMLLEEGFDRAKREFEGDIEDNRLILNEMVIEDCNCCVSTASALCNFSCTCWPADDMTVQAYPMLLWADAVLISTGVNQSMPNSRLVKFFQRMISLDGGYYIKKLPMKDEAYKNRMIQLSQDQPVYDQRLFGRVAGYVITSKDWNNEHEDGVPEKKEFVNYVQGTAGAMGHNLKDYGYFHPETWYFIAAADSDQEYSKDKTFYDQKKFYEGAKKVVLSVMNEAKKFRQNPPKFIGGGRVNRT